MLNPNKAFNTISTFFTRGHYWFVEKGSEEDRRWRNRKLMGKWMDRNYFLLIGFERKKE